MRRKKKHQKFINTKKIIPETKIETKILSVFILISFILLIIESNDIENTINGLNLFWASCFIGIVLATIIIVILESKFIPYFKNTNSNSTYISLCFGFFIFTPGITNFINSSFLDNVETKRENYHINRKEISYSGKSSSNSYYLFVEMKNKSEERFHITKEIYDKFYDNGIVVLCTKKGRLGYELVTKFER